MITGRPREHDREKLAKELLEWAKLDDSTNLNGFCCTRNPPISAQKITLYRDECPAFREAYHIARTFLAARREKKLSNKELHSKAYEVNAAVYDQFLKEEKMEQLAYKAKLKAQEQKNYSDEEESKHKEILDLLRKNRQSAKSE